MNESHRRRSFSGSRITRAFGLVLVLAGCGVLGAGAQDRHAAEVAAPVTEERVVGPYDVHVLAGGPAFSRPVPGSSAVLKGTGAFTLSLWVEISGSTPRTTLLAGVGDATAEFSRFVGLRDGRPMLRYGKDTILLGAAALPLGLHCLAVISDGVTATLSVDGKPVAQGTPASGPVAPQLVMAPTAALPGLPAEHFGGDLLRVTLLPEALTAQALAVLATQVPQAAATRWHDASLAWPVQTRAQAGYEEPQDPSLLPVSRAPLGKPVVQPLPPASAPVLLPMGEKAWALRARWKLIAAPAIAAPGGKISEPGFADAAWMQATVPGTVLTSMVDRGLYADPDFGLNNMAIPESLNKQDYWYRIEFAAPQEVAGQHVALTFLGINYAAEVWLNGQRLGDVRGAFLRGKFDVTTQLRAKGLNALAVRISPPPHPGIPHEQSIKGGPGENGGALCLDGPTFVATEGWDWIPAVRDRNSGIWQDVVLTVTGGLTLGDAQVITHLPLPDISQAEVSVEVPVHNASTEPVQARLHADFEGVAVDKTITLAPGDLTVKLTSAEFPQLHLAQPRLWWPNGYGKPELYHLHLVLFPADAAEASDRKDLAFGVREVTYRLSVFDHTGHLRRAEIAPAEARAAGSDLVDVRHAAMRQTAEYWAPSLTPAGESSAAVTPVTDEAGFTDLVIKVNGVRIAARGGNWGMDDSRKRVSREHLEPFFRLHREAHVNIIRNWVGQNTEETFYQLADEYGMMVWNDFWASTQDYNVEPQDVPLFLANARDVVRRFRNHPSIVLWCGRNEGVPQPILNEGLIAVLHEEDGTRYYTPGSNRIDLRNSGPYLYQDPVLFYTTLDKGFSVELGIPSLSTLESLRASMAVADQWPVSDAWAYHDWHQSGNGDTHPTVQHLETEFGAATSLADFERKMQMLNYVDHRAIFEGFNQHLFAPNSGRMLWMTQPAWPSNEWQILSSDYDTQASFYAVKKACEPLHVQLDLSDYTLTGVNTTGADAHGLNATATVYDLAGKQLFTQRTALDLPANKAVALSRLPLADFFAKSEAVLVLLQMTDGMGAMVSRNVYWLAAEESGYRALNAMAQAQVGVSIVEQKVEQNPAQKVEGERTLTVTLHNSSSVPALAAKMTLQNVATHERILPAYYSDNYVSLLAGETLQLTIQFPVATPGAKRVVPEVALRGWNVAPAMAKVVGAR